MTIGPEFSAVLEAAQAGDRVALERIYRDVAPVVVGYLRANGAREPEDIASEVFVSMVSRFRQFAGDEAHFRSWLLTITHRRLIDELRRQGRRLEDPVPAEQLGEQNQILRNNESEAMTRLRARGVLECLEQLTEDQRSVLVLRVLADLPINTIAEITGKPETAVKALLRRALASLERLLSQEEANDVDAVRSAGP